MIQSSRLHHWLPLPQVPILKDEVLCLYQAKYLPTLATLLVVTRRFSILENITRSVSQVS